MNMDLIFDKYPNELFPFDFDTYFNSEIHCELVTTNCITGKAEYMTEDHDRDRLMKICRASSSMPLLTPIVNVDGMPYASSSMPLLTPIVNVDGTPYLDGGLADSVPLGRARKLGNKKIVIVLTKNSYPNLVRTIFRRSFEYNKLMNHIDQLEKAGKIFVIRPQVKPVSRLERSKESLEAFYEHGYQHMEDRMDELRAFLKA